MAGKKQVKPKQVKKEVEIETPVIKAHEDISNKEIFIDALRKEGFEVGEKEGVIHTYVKEVCELAPRSHRMSEIAMNVNYRGSFAASTKHKD